MEIRNNKKDRLQIWECALLIALCICLCSGLWARAAGQRLSSELVRLHVVAESDSEEDQALKLKVRDAVLEYLSPRLEGVSSAQEARGVIERELRALEELAWRTALFEGAPVRVTAQLATESFPTRDYESFSLPAGDYVSLRISLGDGGGKNWWCVVFPPLCISSVESTQAFSELSEENSRLIQTSDGEYRLKFHIIELFERIRQAFS